MKYATFRYDTVKVENSLKVENGQCSLYPAQETYFPTQAMFQVHANVSDVLRFFSSHWET